MIVLSPQWAFLYGEVTSLYGIGTLDSSSMNSYLATCLIVGGPFRRIIRIMALLGLSVADVMSPEVSVENRKSVCMNITFLVGNELSALLFMAEYNAMYLPSGRANYNTYIIRGPGEGSSSWSITYSDKGIAPGNPMRQTCQSIWHILILTAYFCNVVQIHQHVMTLVRLYFRKA